MGLISAISHISAREINSPAPELSQKHRKTTLQTLRAPV